MPREFEGPPGPGGPEEFRVESSVVSGQIAQEREASLENKRLPLIHPDLLIMAQVFSVPVVNELIEFLAKEHTTSTQLVGVKVLVGLGYALIGAEYYGWYQKRR